MHFPTWNKITWCFNMRKHFCSLSIVQHITDALRLSVNIEHRTKQHNIYVFVHTMERNFKGCKNYLYKFERKSILLCYHFRLKRISHMWPSPEFHNIYFKGVQNLWKLVLTPKRNRALLKTMALTFLCIVLFSPSFHQEIVHLLTQCDSNGLDKIQTRS